MRLGSGVPGACSPVGAASSENRENAMMNTRTTPARSIAMRAGIAALMLAAGGAGAQPAEPPAPARAAVICGAGWMFAESDRPAPKLVAPMRTQ